MQTFLPYPDFKQSAKCLDYRRLGKQRVEVKQILEFLTGKSLKTKTLLEILPPLKKKGYLNHPAVLMWRGYEYAICCYGIVICLEWRSRSYKDNCLPEIAAMKDDLLDTGMPPWFGCEKYHASHRSNLLRKKPEYYGKYGWEEPDNLEYYWPIRK